MLPTVLLIGVKWAAKGIYMYAKTGFRNALVNNKFKFYFLSNFCGGPLVEKDSFKLLKSSRNAATQFKFIKILVFAPYFFSKIPIYEKTLNDF